MLMTLLATLIFYFPLNVSDSDFVAGEKPALRKGASIITKFSNVTD